MVHHEAPGVHRLPSLVDGLALVDSPEGGCDDIDLQHAGHAGPGHTTELPYGELAGVGDWLACPAPLDHTGRVRGEAAGETHVVTAREERERGLGVFV